ncbi:C39 family peptidase [Paenisporosarcina sp. TG20]|uniref:C39 family peptidase n=1 Tax=Paenisporosarcina sp. TG20 TaxID=1211706 RepID=UPI00031E21A2|nr:C39 family peptidase [Paenisporosarcina sp. TG20]
MKYLHHKFLRLLLLLLCITFLIVGMNTTSSRDLGSDRFLESNTETIKTFRNFLLINSRNNHPIPDYIIYILDSKTDNLVSSAKSDSSGEGKIDGLIPGKEYIIKTAYIDESGQSVDNKEEKSYIHESTDTFIWVETFIERKANYIDVPTVMQYPELPNGCEITSLTAILNFYGMDISKTTISDRYLPKVAFSTKEGKRFGANPHIAYAGNPRNLNDGWYAFATPIVNAAKDVIVRNKKNLYAENVSGSTREEILSYIDQGIPVIVWVTRDLSPPIKRGGWYTEGTNKFHSSFTNLHTVVLNGWEDGKVQFMNPLKGQQIISEDVFFDSYEALESQAIIITKLPL